MSDLDDYRQRMKEKFERDQGVSRQGTGLLGGLFQTKEPTQSNQPLSDFELAKQLQENEMRNLQKQNSQNTYDYRNGNPQDQAERYNNYRPPVNNDIEMNDFTNSQTKRSETIPLRSTTMDTRPRNTTWLENRMGLLSSQIKEQMTPVTKYCCYLAGFFSILIFLIILKSL